MSFYGASYSRYNLDFRFLAKTSREELRRKETWFVKVWRKDNPEVYGIGECGLFRGLSADDVADYEAVLRQSLEALKDGMPTDLRRYSSIAMGLETAMSDLAHGGRRIIHASGWTRGEEGLRINGLIWMGSQEEMLRRLEEKLSEGFRCIKLKIGGIDFEKEIEILETIRSHYPSNQLELRLDANGAFTEENALSRLDRLARYTIHSIEQPLGAKTDHRVAGTIYRLSPIPVALDESLIGVWREDEQRRLLERTTPSYIILKPTLCGGLSGASQWVRLAKEYGLGWWATSALESNIGLNAIAQWAAHEGVEMPQGLGTGQIYENNIPSPIYLDGEQLRYNPEGEWNFEGIEWTEV